MFVVFLCLKTRRNIMPEKAKYIEEISVTGKLYWTVFGKQFSLLNE